MEFNIVVLSAYLVSITVLSLPLHRSGSPDLDQPYPAVRQTTPSPNHTRHRLASVFHTLPCHAAARTRPVHMDTTTSPLFPTGINTGSSVAFTWPDDPSTEISRVGHPEYWRDSPDLLSGVGGQFATSFSGRRLSWLTWSDIALEEVKAATSACR